MRARISFAGAETVGRLLRDIEVHLVQRRVVRKWCGSPDRHLRLAIRLRHGKLRAGRSISNWLLPLREKAAVFARLAPDELVHALVIRYDPAPESAGIEPAHLRVCRWRFSRSAGDNAVPEAQAWRL
jgi:hypothetical protein